MGLNRVFSIHPKNTLTIALGVLAVLSVVWRGFKPQTQVHAFPVEVLTQGDIDQVKVYLFNDLLPVVKTVRMGLPASPKSESGETYMDPRGILYFLWDDLSGSERESIAVELGYQRNVTRRQVLSGPHPEWFS